MPKKPAPTTGDKALTVDDALALIDAWERTPEHAQSRELARYQAIYTHIERSLRERAPQLDAMLIPLA